MALKTSAPVPSTLSPKQLLHGKVDPDARKSKKGEKACLNVHLAVLHVLLLIALGTHEEAQHLVPFALPPFLLSPALLWHIDVQPQVCCLSGGQVAQLEVSPAGKMQLTDNDMEVWHHGGSPSASSLLPYLHHATHSHTVQSKDPAPSCTTVVNTSGAQSICQCSVLCVLSNLAVSTGSASLENPPRQVCIIQAVHPRQATVLCI